MVQRLFAEHHIIQECNQATKDGLMTKTEWFEIHNINPATFYRWQQYLRDEFATEVLIQRSQTSVQNEIVISNGPISRLIKYDLFCDGIQIQSSRADGIIIATPTGSTAYSMSAGGPVADPSLDCIITTPICPFALNQRPVIYGANTILEISSVACRENDVYLTIDGSEVYKIAPDDKIIIKRSAVKSKLVRLRHRSFLEVLHEKMS